MTKSSSTLAGGRGALRAATIGMLFGVLLPGLSVVLSLSVSPWEGMAEAIHDVRLTLSLGVGKAIVWGALAGAVGGLLIRSGSRLVCDSGCGRTFAGLVIGTAWAATIGGFFFGVQGIGAGMIGALAAVLVLMFDRAPQHDPTNQALKHVRDKVGRNRRSLTVSCCGDIPARPTHGPRSGGIAINRFWAGGSLRPGINQRHARASEVCSVPGHDAHTVAERADGARVEQKPHRSGCGLAGLRSRSTASPLPASGDRIRKSARSPRRP